VRPVVAAAAGTGAAPLAQLRTVLSAAGDALGCVPMLDVSPAERVEQARRLTAVVPAVLAQLHRHATGAPAVPPDPALGHTAASYLSLVLFYDGRPTAPCGSRSTLAWTNIGSRAVHVCWDQFLAQQRWNAGLTANTIIHEALHTLGLGETPPDPRVITAKVAERCGN